MAFNNPIPSWVAGAGINWANPITRGLVFCAVPTGHGYRDAVSGRLPDVVVDAGSDAGPLATNIGRVSHFAYGDYVKWQDVCHGINAGACTLAALMRFDGTSGSYQTPVSINENLGIYAPGSGALSLQSDSTSSGTRTYSNNNAIVANEWQLCSVAFGQSGATNDSTGYINGVAQLTATAGTAYSLGDSGDITLGRGQGSEYCRGHDIAIVPIWNRKLSAKEQALLAADPWLVLKKPDYGFLYFGGRGGVASYTLAADSTSFSFSASVVGLAAARKISVLAGDFLFAGSNAALLSARQITIDAASFGVTAPNASLLRAGVLSALSGGYALTGIDAGLSLAGSYTLTADPVPFVLSAVDSSLLVARALGVDSGDYVLSPVDAGLLATRVLGADSAAYDLAALDASLLAARGLGVDSGAYVLSGTDATLAYGVSYKLTASPVAFSLAGIDGQLQAARLLPAASAGYTLTGGDAALFMARAISADPASFGLTAADIALLADRALQALTQNYYLSGQAVNLIYSGMGVMQDLEGVITLVSNTPKITLTSNTPVITVH